MYYGRGENRGAYERRLPHTQMKAADLEWYLASQGIVETEMDENPSRDRGANSINVRRGKGARGRRDSDDEAGNDDY